MRLFGLIGYPLTHSFSEKYFTDKFKKEKITDAAYKTFPLQSVHKFPKIVKENEFICGFNVTSPYKQSIISYLDEIDKSASEVNAVNVIKVVRNKNSVTLVGYNTDVFGFENSLKRTINPDVKSALILGTGGAAKAVSAALKHLNISFQFVSREKNNTDFLNYNDLNEEIIKHNLLIINATPLGMFPGINKKPNIPYEFLTEKHHLFDLIYNPEKTQFLSEGEKHKTTVQNGLEMLYLQADKSWKIFNL